MESKKYNVLFVSGIFDYGKSVSGAYILYQILKKVKNINLMVLPLFPQTIHPIDIDDFLPYLPNHRNVSSIDIINILPEHDIMFISGEDLTNQQIYDICKHFNSKFINITMSNWMFGNTSHYPELENDYEGAHVDNRLKLYNSVNAHIVPGSTHSLEVMRASKFRDLSYTFIPLPFEEIEVFDGHVDKRTDKKTILWGTQQPENPRKGKIYFENILDWLHKMVKNPSDILIRYIGPTIPLNTKFEVEYLGHIPNRIELSKIYKSSDVFALTSLADAGPMMATECLKNETPLVSFNTNISIDLVKDGKNGYVVDGTEEFAKKLYDILYNKNYHMDLEYIKSFNSEESVVFRYEKMFDDLMNKK
jgi:glycosyltransferase involved in cell wall biosynthesis